MTAQRRPYLDYENPSLPIPEFDLGEVVFLKSGGPKMTVQSALQGCLIRTAWFAGDLRQEGSFEAAGLCRA